MSKSDEIVAGSASALKFGEVFKASVEGCSGAVWPVKTSSAYSRTLKLLVAGPNRMRNKLRQPEIILLIALALLVLQVGNLPAFGLDIGFRSRPPVKIFVHHATPPGLKDEPLTPKNKLPDLATQIEPKYNIITLFDDCKESPCFSLVLFAYGFHFALQFQESLFALTQSVMLQTPYHFSLSSRRVRRSQKRRCL